MSGELFAWHDKGDRLEVGAEPGGPLILRVGNDSTSCAIELAPRAVQELAEWLDAELDVPAYSQVAELDAECRRLEDERDAALRRVAGLERDVERMRAAGLPVEVSS